MKSKIEESLRELANLKCLEQLVTDSTLISNKDSMFVG